MSQSCSHTRNRPCPCHSSSSCSIINVNSIRSNNLLRPKSSSWLSLTFFILICIILILSSFTSVTGHPTKSRSSYDFKHRFVSRFHQPKSQFEDSGSSSFSLSIVSPLDILRQNMVLEMKRQRIRHAKHRQMESNKEILDRIG